MEHCNFKVSFIIIAKHLSFAVLLCFILSGCTSNNSEPTALYNEKANEIIAHIIKKGECDCLLQIPKESLIEIANIERSPYDIRDIAIKKLNLLNNAELDTVINWSRKFELDSLALKKEGIKIITLQRVMEEKAKKDGKLFKLCPQGILAIKKPIFNRQFKKAIVDFSWVFTCVRTEPNIFEFKDNEWGIVEN